MEDYSDFRCPWVSIKDIWHKAEGFRSGYWPEDTLPIDMEKIVERKLGLEIVPEQDMLQERDIDAYLKVDLTGVVVDYDCFMEDRFSTRMRFSYTHEIGHYVLHKEVYAQLPITDPEEWMNFVLTVPEKEYRFLEYQANEFAGRLLVPRSKLIEEVEKSVELIKATGLENHLSEDPTSVLGNISTALGKPFGVSFKVIERRVEREKLWPPEI